jgi:hypothetical protein
MMSSPLFYLKNKENSGVTRTVNINENKNLK